MANRYYTDNKDRKITAPKPPKDNRKEADPKAPFKKVKTAVKGTV